MLFSYPLKKSFLEYFELNQIDNNITVDRLNEYLHSQILTSPDPNQKALEIWDKFVMSNEDFFDMSHRDMKKRIVELRNNILTVNNIYYTLNAFGCVGASPFCDKIN